MPFTVGLYIDGLENLLTDIPSDSPISEGVKIPLLLYENCYHDRHKCDLNKLTHYPEDCGLKIKIPKTKIMGFGSRTSRTPRHRMPYTWYRNDGALESVKDLGLTMNRTPSRNSTWL